MKKTLAVVLSIFLVVESNASVVTSPPGHFTIPTAPAAGTSCTSGAANVFTTTYVQLIASTAAPLYITGIYVERAAVSAATYNVVQLATGGAGSEVVIDQELFAPETGSTVALIYRPIFPNVPVANATRISCKTADSVGAVATLVTLECVAQSNTIAGTTVNANVLSVGGTTQTATDIGAAVQPLDTGTAQSGSSTTITLRAGASGIDNTYNGEIIEIIGATGIGQSRVITGYVASTRIATVDSAWATNPNSTSVYTVWGRAPKLDSLQQTTASSVTGAVGSVTGAVGSVTAGVTVTTNNDKTGYALTQVFPTNFALQVIDGNGRVDVSKVTGTTQTARDLGGQLDAAVSSRMATFALPTNFSSLAITAGGLVDINGKTGFALTSAYDLAKTAAQTGDIMQVSNGTGANQISLSSGAVLLQANQAVNVSQWNGVAVAVPATAGVPDVNAKNINNVPTTSVTAVNANFGTGQPVNFTGTAGSALVQVDVTDFGASAGSFASGIPAVNTTQVGGTVQTARDIGANVDVVLSTRLATSGYTAPDNTDSALAASNTANFQSLLENVGGWRFNAFSVSQAPGGFDLSAVANAIWQYDTASDPTAGTKATNLLKKAGSK